MFKNIYYIDNISYCLGKTFIFILCFRIFFVLLLLLLRKLPREDVTEFRYYTSFTTREFTRAAVGTEQQCSGCRPCVRASAQNIHAGFCFITWRQFRGTVHIAVKKKIHTLKTIKAPSVLKVFSANERHQQKKINPAWDFPKPPPPNAGKKKIKPSNKKKIIK